MIRVFFQPSPLWLCLERDTEKDTSYLQEGPRELGQAREQLNKDSGLI